MALCLLMKMAGIVSKMIGWKICGDCCHAIGKALVCVKNRTANFAGDQGNGAIYDAVYWAPLYSCDEMDTCLFLVSSLNAP